MKDSEEEKGEERGKIERRGKEKEREEEKKSRRTNVYVSAAAVSALAVFGIFLTL